MSTLSTIKAPTIGQHDDLFHAKTIDRVRPQPENEKKLHKTERSLLYVFLENLPFQIVMLIHAIPDAGVLRKSDAYAAEQIALWDLEGKELTYMPRDKHNYSDTLTQHKKETEKVNKTYNHHSTNTNDPSSAQ